MNEEVMPLMEHLTDLKSCIIRSIYGVIAGMIICYAFSATIINFLEAPLTKVMPENSKLIVLSPLEYVFLEFKLAFLFGFVLSLPWILYQVWLFLSPGLYKNEKKFLLLFVSSASIFFILGMAFCYFIALSPMFQYLLDSLPKHIAGHFSVGVVYGFMITILFSFGLVFETPLLVFLLVFFEMISLETIKSYRRHIFVLCFIVGAIMGPPDPLSQTLLAIPTYLLFEVGIFMAGLFLKKKLSSIGV